MPQNKCDVFCLLRVMWVWGGGGGGVSVGIFYTLLHELFCAFILHTPVLYDVHACCVCFVPEGISFVMSA